ncbi:MAG: heme exporter protein CcmB [Actinobacteria bacterium]|nr:heme exporter protein CcmB [Actinomycetota bacterium]MBI3686564.1 heme exporter protein CcmB [Actinomycetota bacterium]
MAVGRLVTREVGIEVAGREATTAVAPFVLVAVLLAGLAFGPAPQILAAVAPGTIWLVTLLAAAPLARGVAAAEQDEGCWDLLRLLVSPTQLLAGKLAAMWLHLLITWALTAALVAVVFPAPFPLAAIVAGPLGALGLAAVTVAFGTLLAAGRRRSGLLSVLLLPSGLPVLVAGTAVGLPGSAGMPWLALLVAYDVLMVVATWAVFPVLLEE